ncbi:MAG: hypothetical protein IKG30_07725 [Clostridiales bacterium]|nr:hypothetical protein [Clostridiales bacterium]
MAKRSAKRAKVIKAMIAFIVILALLTFFSNTIMNLTIPKVMGTYASRGNLSYSNSAKGSITVENQTEVKGLEGRTVDEVLVSNYDTVKAGDTILTLKSVEESEDLQAKRDRLKTLEREKNYDERTPSGTDFTTYYDAINSAKATLSEAEDTLEKVLNKEAVEDTYQIIIDNESAKAVSLEASVSAAAQTVEDIKREIDLIDAQIAPLQSQIEVYIALGTPTPTPVPGTVEVVNTEEPTTTTTATPTTGTDASSTPTSSSSDTSATSSTSETTSATTAATTPATVLDIDGLDPNSPTYEMDKLILKIQQYEDQKAALQSRIASAQMRLDEASAALAECQVKIKEAQDEIAALATLPSETAAQNAVNAAKSAVNSAQKALNDAYTQAGITEDKNRDLSEDRDEEIEKLKKQIDELEQQAKITSITAPASGYIYNIAVSSGDVLTAKQVVTCILPETDRVCSVSFTFTTQAAQNIMVGMPLEVTSGFINGCTVTGIKPDPNNPRGFKIVKCMVDGNDAWPGEEITVNAGKGNDNYKCVVPSSAVSEDNNGAFIYTVVGSSTPLGDKYTVRRVDVTVEATDGSATAIKGEGLDKYDVMIVVRAEKPLEDGQRVRLEDYSSK